MKVLVTGASGFVGKNLTAALENLRDGKDRTRPGLKIDEIFRYDTDSDPELLGEYCRDADFVFNLAGVNRPQESSEFMTGNRDFSERLLGCLKAAGNFCPVMLASSVQASLEGRYAGSEYGRSKLAAEKLFFGYGRETGAGVLVYRFPNIFGKWCRPNYNSVVATFCHNIARGLPIRVDDQSAELELLYIDDLVDSLLDALEGRAESCDYAGAEPNPLESGAYRFAPTTHRVTLGRISELLYEFDRMSETLTIPDIAPGSFEKKLFATYLSYLPPERANYRLSPRTDPRGSFTELLKTESGGQFSVNVSKPGITKGEHWHNSKWEIFIVVSGRALIRERRIDSDELVEFEVDGSRPEAVRMLPGYTHDIINLSDTDELITLMWASESFDPARPDTFSEKV